ncbi:hypothetical protein CHS0354_040496 [Potamilus streckersoni]|uniref:Uncharacterized protein n=1 Tax=Potamilus streckersoni TaxID=2493646 RepID=A0AAE0TKV0_9BIVA|nr:hypothetical protein CHS0354_040496 [Potamilus streckersoni]
MVSPAILLERKGVVNQAAISSGVAIGVAVVIVIIVVIVFYILKRRKMNSAFAPEIMQEEVMDVTFDTMPEMEYAHVTYEHDAVHIADAKRTEEPQNSRPPNINTGKGASELYDESMARAKENPHTRKF